MDSQENSDSAERFYSSPLRIVQFWGLRDLYLKISYKRISLCLRFPIRSWSLSELNAKFEEFKLHFMNKKEQNYEKAATDIDNTTEM